MTATLKAKNIEPGHSIPGLDNGYVIDVEENRGYMSAPSNERYNVGLGDDFICITFNDADGNEAYLVVDKDMPIVVDNAEPHVF